VGGERDGWPLILTRDDVVYAPMSPEALLDTPLRHRVRNAPSLVAYSEMERCAEAIALAHERYIPTARSRSICGTTTARSHSACCSSASSSPRKL
jgi:hypothetical protein